MPERPICTDPRGDNTDADVAAKSRPIAERVLGKQQAERPFAALNTIAAETNRGRQGWLLRPTFPAADFSLC